MAAPVSIPFTPSTSMPPLASKVLLITGATSGLGLAAALELAQHSSPPAHIFLTARDPSSTKGRRALAAVTAVALPGTTAVTLLPLDLASLESVKAAARTFLKAASRLDVLMLNAGVLGCPPAVTADGYEVQFATNHLGHALLVKLLAPLLIETAEGVGEGSVRVVVLGSGGYKHKEAQTISFETLKDRAKILDVGLVTPTVRYCQSKLANILYAQEMAKRYTQFTTVAVDPGPTLTDLFTREPGDKEVERLQTVVLPKHGLPVEVGVKNQLWAATAEEGVVSGAYYEPVGRGGLEEGAALDEDLRARLWEWTEKELEGHTI